MAQNHKQILENRLDWHGQRSILPKELSFEQQWEQFKKLASKEQFDERFAYHLKFNKSYQRKCCKDKFNVVRDNLSGMIKKLVKDQYFKSGPFRTLFKWHFTNQVKRKNIFSRNTINNILEDLTVEKINKYVGLIPGYNNQTYFSGQQIQGITLTLLNQLSLERTIKQRQVPELRKDLASEYYADWRENTGTNHLELGRVEDISKKDAVRNIRKDIYDIQRNMHGIDVIVKYAGPHSVITLEGDAELEILQEYMPHIKPEKPLHTSFGDMTYSHDAESLGKIDLQDITYRAFTEFSERQINDLRSLSKMVNDIQRVTMAEEIEDLQGSCVQIVTEKWLNTEASDFNWSFTDNDTGYAGRLQLSKNDDAVHVSGKYDVEPGYLDKMEWLVR